MMATLVRLTDAAARVATEGTGGGRSIRLILLGEPCWVVGA